MKTRSRSVPKICSLEAIRKMTPTLKSLHDRISSRVYGEKPLLKCSPLPYLEKPPLAHLHSQKSFDSISVSSPNTRKQKIQKARLYKNQEPTQPFPSSSIHSFSTSRLDKSSEILSQAQQLFVKEQENRGEISKISKGYSVKIIEKIKGINKKLSLAGIPGIRIIKKQRRLKRILTNNNQ